MAKSRRKKKKKPSKKLDNGVVALRKRYREVGLPGSYRGAGDLARALGGGKKKRKAIESALRGEQAYTLHRPVVRRFARRKVRVGGPFDQWQADLVDCSAYKSDNAGVRFLLCIIDVFSKMAWVRALKTKTGREVAGAFEGVLRDEAPKAPLRLQTDKGSEFRAREFKDVARRWGIDLFSTENEDIKACIVERFQRTLQTMIHRYFTAERTRSFVDVLPAMLKTYNTTRHGATGMAPADVRPHHTEDIYNRLYRNFAEDRPAPEEAGLRVGDSVRISKARVTFEKGYLPSWSREIFTVTAVLRTTPRTYRLADDSGEAIRGAFYGKELQRVDRPDYWDVEAVLDTRRRKGGKREYLVKWAGYPASFNSWEVDIIGPDAGPSPPDGK